MTWVKITAIVALGSLSGCGVVLREVRYPGGYPGHLLDKRTFDASANKRLQLLRGTMVLAMAARIGEGSVRGEDGDGFAKLLGNAAAEINHAAANLGMTKDKTCEITEVLPSPAPIPLPPPSPTPDLPVVIQPSYAPDTGCIGYYVNFEADVARVESRVTRAMIAALPTDRAREFLNKLTKGDLLSAMWSILKAAGDMAGSFHRGAGVYRSGLETVAAGMAKNCTFEPTKRDRGSRVFDETTMTVLEAADCLELDRKSLFDADDIAAEDLSEPVKEVAFHAVMRIIRTSCVALPLSNELERKELEDSRYARRVACAKLIFKPEQRLDRVPL